MVDAQAVGQRMERAHAYLIGRAGVRLKTFAQLAERVTEAHGGRNFTPGMISEYQKGIVVFLSKP